MPFIMRIAFLLMACSPSPPDENEEEEARLADARRRRKARMKKIDEMYGIEPGPED
jgi:hypothetical protein